MSAFERAGPEPLAKISTRVRSTEGDAFRLPAQAAAHKALGEALMGGEADIQPLPHSYGTADAAAAAQRGGKGARRRGGEGPARRGAVRDERAPSR